MSGSQSRPATSPIVVLVAYNSEGLTQNTRPAIDEDGCWLPASHSKCNQSFALMPWRRNIRGSQFFRTICSCIRSVRRVKHFCLPEIRLHWAVGRGRATVTRRIILLHKKGSLAMEFFTSWTFIGIMAVLLIALVGLLIFLRMRPPQD